MAVPSQNHARGSGIRQLTGTLAAALLLGTAFLAFPAAQTTHAAVNTPSGDVDPGDGGGSSAAKEKPKPTGGGKNCTWKNKDGSVDTYKPGSVIHVGGAGLNDEFKCGTDGKWHQVREGAPPVIQAPSGGVYKPVP